MRNKKDIVFHITYINPIGGVEQWIYYIAKLYGDRDITLLYNVADGRQLRRIKKLGINTEKYDENIGIDCRKLIVCYDVSILDNDKVVVDNEDIVEFIHCDFKYHEGGAIFHKRVKKYYAVSDLARDSFIEMTGFECETMYNPICVDKPKKVLTLISPTRLAKDKGKIWDRMVFFARKLQEYDIPFIWFVYSNVEKPTDIKNFVFMQPELDISPYIKNATYLCQFSDTEGYAYTLNEALCMSVPVLCTNFKVTGELGIKNGENGYVIPFEAFEDENTFDWKRVIDKIYNNIPEFDYTPKTSDEKWKMLLGEPTRQVKMINNYGIKCKVLINYKDIEPENIILKNGYKLTGYSYSNDVPYVILHEGDEVVFKEKRADVLIDRKWVEELDIYELG